MKRHTLALMAALLTLASCSTTPDDTNRLRDYTGQPDGTRAVDTGAGWTFDIDDQQQCMWVHAERITDMCIGTHYLVGDVAAQVLQGGDVQLTLVMVGSKEPLVAWWSTSAGRDRIPFVEVQPEVWAAVSPLAEGANAWGLQARSVDGTVQHVISVPQNAGFQR